MNYFLSTAAEGFVPSHAPLKNNKHLNILFQSTQPRRGKDKSELQGLTPSSRGHACRMRRGVWGHASILSVMPNTAPDNYYFIPLIEILLEYQIRSNQSLSRVRLFVAPWAVAHQAPLSMDFSRQEYWSGEPFPSPGDLLVWSHVRHYWQSGGTALNPLSLIRRHGPGMKELGFVILTCFFLSSAELTEKEY